MSLPPCPCCGIMPSRGGSMSHGPHVIVNLTLWTPDAWCEQARGMAVNLRATGQPVHENFINWEKENVPSK